MRIGLVAPPWLPVPPLSYGGTEAVIASLAEGLRDRGHDVVLATTGDSTCDVRRESLYPRALTEQTGAILPELRHVIHAYEQLGDREVIHDHTTLGPLSRAGQTRPCPVLTTNHGPFDDHLTPLYRQIARDAHVVALSEAHARSARDVPISAVVHHGIDLRTHAPAERVGEHLMFLGRMSPDKGVADAIDLARAAGRPLVIAAKCRTPEEVAYFEREVRPRLGADILHVGEVDRQEKVALLGGAYALLNPIRWPEPFGLAMVEALACGTPVVARPRGSAPEIVRHGETGFLAEGTGGLTAAIDAVATLDRAACRRDAAERFSVDAMVDAYLACYERALTPRRNAWVDAG